MPAALLRAALVVGGLLVLAAGAYVGLRLLIQVAPVALAVVAALLLAALLAPLARALGRLGLPRWLTALVNEMGLIAVLAGALFLAGRRAATQLDDLGQQVGLGLDRLRDILTDRLGLPAGELDRLRGDLMQALRGVMPGFLPAATGAVEVVGGALLTAVLLFFLLRDGAGMWRWLLARLPGGRRSMVDAAARSGWHALESYTRGIVVIASVDAIGIGAALFVLRVPLALSLALLTFFSAFVPIAGATIAGAAATLVTFVTNGPRDALLVLAAVILVQQAEGHLLHPFVMRQAVQLHPVVTLTAVAAGTLLGGVAGALVAVPVCAFIYHTAAAYSGQTEGADGRSTGRRFPAVETGTGGKRQNRPLPEEVAVTTPAHTPPMSASNEADDDQLSIARTEGDAYGAALQAMADEDGAAVAHAGDFLVAFVNEEAEGMYAPDDNDLTWREAAPEATSHLEVAVADAADGRFVPGLEVRVEVTEDGRQVFNDRLPFLWHPFLHHYGANARLPGPGPYSVTVHIDAPTFMRHDPINGKRYAEGVTVRFPDVQFAQGRKLSPDAQPRGADAPTAGADGS